MKCLSPGKAWKLPGGGITTRRRVSTLAEVPVPCGKCDACRLGRAQQWATRCLHELKEHKTASFITLTYARPPLTSNGMETLNPVDLRNFWKRLRKEGREFRYFAVGEYGSQTLRPHYHAIVFGQDWMRDRTVLRPGKHPLFNSQDLEKAWQHGHVSIGECTPETIGYTTRYSLKAFGKCDSIGHDVADEREPVFLRTSRRPALGRKYYEDNRENMFRHGHVRVNGKRRDIPDYYIRLERKRMDRVPEYEEFLENRLESWRTETDYQRRARQVILQQSWRDPQRQRREPGR